MVHDEKQANQLLYSQVYSHYFTHFVRVGEAMQVASDLRRGGMVAVTGVSAEVVQRLCEEVLASEVNKREKDSYLAIGNYLGANNFAISGDFEACLALQSAAQLEPGVKISRLLAVAGAFHTPHMLPARHTLSELLKQISLTPKAMTCPVYSNVTGDTYYDTNTNEEDIKTALLDQLVQPVRWDKSMHLLLSNSSLRCSYEIGPGTVCSGIVKMLNRRAKVSSIKL